MSLLPHVRQESAGSATACVIWLHGLGANGHDFEPIATALNLDTVRFIFPHAPHMPVTANQGYVMPAWYDLLAIGRNAAVDQAGLSASSARIRAFIDAQINEGLPSERIVLAGFSQGGAVAYDTALSYPQRLGGLLACSTYFPTAETLVRTDANRDLPIEVHHGTLDSVVVPSRGLQAAETLASWGYPVTVRQYEMEHEVCLEQVQDIRTWLVRTLSLEG